MFAKRKWYPTIYCQSIMDVISIVESIYGSININGKLGCYKFYSSTGLIGVAVSQPDEIGWRFRLKIAYTL